MLGHYQRSVARTIIHFISGFELIAFRGFRDPNNGDFTPTYRLEFNPDRTPTEEDYFDSITKDFGTFSSRWFMQLGFRYTF